MVVVHEGTYNENVIMHKRLKLQGVGPGGSIGSPETGPLGGAIDDIRQSIPGSVIDGRNFHFDRADAWNAKLASLPRPAGFGDVPGGAGITVVPENDCPVRCFRRAGPLDRRPRHHDEPGRRRRRHPGQRLRQRGFRSRTTSSRTTAACGAAAIALGLPSEFNAPAGQPLNSNRLDNQNDDVR